MYSFNEEGHFINFFGHCVLGGYKFYGLFPSEIGEVTLDWSNDAIQEYTVTWSFDYFEDLNSSGLENQ